jgi:hypothetical protein
LAGAVTSASEARTAAIAEPTDRASAVAARIAFA